MADEANAIKCFWKVRKNKASNWGTPNVVTELGFNWKIEQEDSHTTEAG